MSNETEPRGKLLSVTVERARDLQMNSVRETVKENWPVPGTSVLLSQQHCIDSIGPDADGFYEFRYDYNMYEFSDGDLTIRARDYTDSPGEAHFLGLQQADAERFLGPADFELPLMQVAIRYFREQGKTAITWLDPSNDVDGYSPIPASP